MAVAQPDEDSAHCNLFVHSMGFGTRMLYTDMVHVGDRQWLAMNSIKSLICNFAYFRQGKFGGT